MIIRKAKVEDIESIQKLIRQAFTLYQNSLKKGTDVVALHETPQDVERDIREHTVYVAENNGVILGTIRYKFLSPHLAYIYRFGVEPSEHNAGIGTKLLNYVLEECKAQDIYAVALHTNAKYFKLARYYYGCEFYVHSTTTDHGYIRALFVKELSPTPTDLSPAFSL